jgi:hypothetical protein
MSNFHARKIAIEMGKRQNISKIPADRQNRFTMNKIETNAQARVISRNLQYNSRQRRSNQSFAADHYLRGHWL